MKKEPLHVIIRNLRHLSLDDQVAELIGRVAAERPYSIRRNELLSLLQGKRTKQIKRDTRAVAS